MTSCSGRLINQIMSDPVGQLVEFIDKNRINIGLVQSAKKTKLNILTSADKELSLPQGRVLLMTSGGGASGGNRQAQVEALQDILQRREDMAGQVDVLELWELVAEEDDALPLEELAGLAFSGDVGGDHLSATLRALFDEHVHFKLSGGQFLPLSPEQLEQKQIQAEREENRRQQIDASVEFLNNLPGQPPFPEPPEGLIDLLVDLVVHEDESSSAKIAKEIVSLAEVGGRRQLFNLLVRLGVFDKHENLPLRQEGIHKGFSPSIMEAVGAISVGAALEDGGRSDLTGLHTFTIDGAYTSDFDDALSFQPDGRGGGVLGVHITDAGAVLESDGVLDMEGRGRGTSIYMPDDRIPMLPPMLSEDALSLRQDMLRPAISTFVELDSQGNILDWRLERSIIRVDSRLTYDEADGLLGDDMRLSDMHKVCLALKRKRAQAGAYFLPLPEVIVGIDDETGEVYVRRIDREGATREMVAETAILANWLAARYLMESEAPCLYRRQAPPSQPLNEGDPEDIYLHFSQRRLLNPADLTTKPGLHSSLGVDPYTHATSPIRRYLDLVVQRQLGSVLAGREPAYTKQQLKDIAQEVEPVVRRAGRVRNMRQRYWLMRWLEARRGQELPAIAMEPQMRRWSILLPDIMMLTGVPKTSDLKLKPGQQVTAIVEKADAFNDILRIKLV